MTLPIAPTNSHRSLIDPWSTWASSWIFALGLFVACVVIWLSITGFVPERLVRTGPWELLSMGLVCVWVSLGVKWLRRYLPSDPRGPHIMGVIAALCAVALFAVAVVTNLTPDWVYPFGTKRIHALNGGLIGSLFTALGLIAWLVIADMRLSALEPGREIRMRAQRDAEPESSEMPTDASLWQRLSRWLKPVGCWLTWTHPVHAESKLLDVFTWPRVLAMTVLDAILFAFGLGLLTSILINAGLFGDTKTAKVVLFSMDAAMPGWFGEGGYMLIISAGTWALAIARRWAKWMNHSLTGATTVVWVTHLGMAGTAVAIIGTVPQIPWLHQAIFSLSVLCAMRPMSVLNARSQAIASALRVSQNEQAVRAEAQQALALADLKALQAQIEPHFLYNTLANLQLLIRLDTTRADAMTGHLIDYLRSRLPLMRAPHASLSGEFEMVRSYLEILKIRMGERLSIGFDLPDNCADVQIPPLVVMTLVENAVKHGLEPKRGGGRIDVSARLSGDWVCIRVVDTGVGFAATNSTGTGLGLANIQERLRLSHPDARDASGQGARVILLQNQPQGVIAELHLPISK